MMAWLWVDDQFSVIWNQPVLLLKDQVGGAPIPQK
jgi:hypothetical protein